MIPKYDRILLDADDTLFDFQTGNRNAVGQLMDELGLASPTVFDEYQAVNHACWEALERGEMTQETLHVERFRRFLAKKSRGDDPAAVADRFAELLGRQAIPLPGAEAFVRALAAERTVVLLTNGIARIQRSRLARSPMARHFHRVVISQEVGFAKPDPRIFELALEGAPPQRALMIGDGAFSDVLGANRAGVDACWFNPGGRPLPEGVRAEYDARSLEDCLKIALQPLS